MKHLAITFITLGFFLFIVTASYAQATRTWVSGVGDDVNPCSRTAPCKTFAGAISKTATNGEINCLDPAGYGAVTITKSITIDCEDTQGSILAALVNGVIINITGPDAKKSVKLRGLSINGAGTGINGVKIIAASSVHLEDMVIDGFTQNGVSVENTTGTVKVFVSNTTIRSNAAHALNFFIVGANATLAVVDSRLTGNTGNGINLASATTSSVKDTQITGNGTAIAITAGDIAVMNCIISGNTTGISAAKGATARISCNMISGNGIGLSISGGAIVSFGNNVINGNTTNGAPSSTVPVQ